MLKHVWGKTVPFCAVSKKPCKYWSVCTCFAESLVSIAVCAHPVSENLVFCLHAFCRTPCKKMMLLHVFARGVQKTSYILHGLHVFCRKNKPSKGLPFFEAVFEQPCKYCYFCIFLAENLVFYCPCMLVVQQSPVFYCCFWPWPKAG